MRPVSQIPEVKNGNSCSHCEGPYEHWGKSSKYQMFRCNSCKVVLFMKPEELSYLKLLEPSGADEKKLILENEEKPFSLSMLNQNH